MTLIKKFTLFLESQDVANPANVETPNILEFSSDTLPIFGVGTVQEMDSENFLSPDGYDDFTAQEYWDAFSQEAYEARMIEEINSFIAESEMKEHLLGLGVGIEDLKAVEFHAGRMGQIDLYFDLIMEEDWKDMMVEYVQNLRPARLDAYLSQKFKGGAGYISFMPQNKQKLLIDLKSKEDVERGASAFLQFVLGDQQLEEWGTELMSHLQNNISVYDFDNTGGDEDDEEENDEEEGDVEEDDFN